MVRKSRKRMSPKGAVLFASVFIVVGAVTLVVGLLGVVNANASRHWPSVPGNVVSSAVERHVSHSSSKSGSSTSTTYHAEIMYQYTVNGSALHGKRVAYGDYGSGNPSHAQGIVNRYPKGASVTVYYKPTKPGTCVLEPGMKLQAWLVPGIGALFAGAGSLLVVGLPKAIRKRQAAREMEEASLDEE